MRRAILLAALVAAAAPAAAQTVAIEGGTVHTAAGPPIQGGTVLIQNGRITAVGTNVAVPAGARRIDARGKWVTPGLFESGTVMGLTEVGAVNETNDYRLAEGATGDQVAAAFNVMEGLNPRSMVIPVTRIAGITTVVSRPTGGLIAGQAVAIDLDGDRMDQMVIRSPVAMFASIAENSRDAGGGGRPRQHGGRADECR